MAPLGGGIPGRWHQQNMGHGTSGGEPGACSHSGQQKLHGTDRDQPSREVHPWKEVSLLGTRRPWTAWSLSGRSGCCRFLEKVRPPDLSGVLWAKRPNQATFRPILGDHPPELSAQWNIPGKLTRSNWEERGCSRLPGQLCQNNGILRLTASFHDKEGPNCS